VLDGRRRVDSATDGSPRAVPQPFPNRDQRPRRQSRGLTSVVRPQLCDRFRMDVDESYLAAAQIFADLVSAVPKEMWESPGLGVWNLLELVGHTSTALSGVLTTLDQPAQTMVVASPEAYYAIGRTLDPSVYAAAVADATASASAQAQALGIDPASAVATLVNDVAIRLSNADHEQLVLSAAGGMRLWAWLATRTFELTVHTLDIAAVTGIAAPLTPEALADAASLAARIAASAGTGEPVLRALTGRGTLPTGFSSCRQPRGRTFRMGIACKLTRRVR
jgi:hypothetical protein